MGSSVGSRAGPAEVGVWPQKPGQGPVNSLAALLNYHCTKGMSEMTRDTALCWWRKGNQAKSARENMKSPQTHGGHRRKSHGRWGSPRTPGSSPALVLAGEPSILSTSRHLLQFQCLIGKTRGLHQMMSLAP